MKLETRFAAIIVVSTALAVLLTNTILTSRLKADYQATARKEAREKALLVRYGLLSTMMSTNDYDEIDRIINFLKSGQNFSFRMVRSKHVIKQHGIRRGEIPKSVEEEDALRDGEIKEILESDTRLKFIYPFITDERCGACHMGLDGKPVPAGMVNGAAVMEFDLTGRKMATEALAGQVALVVSVILVAMAAVMIILIHKTVVSPIKSIASAITGFQEERFNVDLPAYSTTEIKIMADEVRAAALLLAERKGRRELEIKEERERNTEARKFIMSRAQDLGIDCNSKLTDVINSLAAVVDAGEQTVQMSKALKYMVSEESRFMLPNDLATIPAVSSYLSNIVDADHIQKRAIELTLDEALGNAIIHGNLEIPSSLKDDDLDSYSELIAERSGQEPYASRRVEVQFAMKGKDARFRIRDEGKGFNWRKALGEETDIESIHGRGVMIMRAMATSLEFNAEGNEITLVFDLGKQASA
ncbi:MAG: ATP-binding protein [Nitrospinae bacterium]|nr:ATP-binding protein [Nitrospinota bacterium]